MELELETTIKRVHAAMKNKWQAVPAYHAEQVDLDIERIFEDISDNEIQVTISPSSGLAKHTELKFQFVLLPQEAGEELVEGKGGMEAIVLKFACPKLLRKLKGKTLRLTVQQST